MRHRPAERACETRGLKAAWRRGLIGAAIAAALGGTSLAGSPSFAQTAPAMPDVSRLPPISPLAKPSYPGEFPLYPDRDLKGLPEQWETYLGGPIVRNVVTPTLIPMRPAPGKANGAAVIFAPGGGFMYLGMGDPEPQRLVDEGVTVFILKYRTTPTERDSREFLVNLFAFLGKLVADNRQPGGAVPMRATPEALEDGLAAVRLVRSRAGEWGVDPKRIGFMGGSAGAMTALGVAFTDDALARPDFLVAIIGPKKVGDVPATAPPLFAAASVDDPLSPGSIENLVSAWSKAGRPVEAHFYERGGHGLPKGTTGERWVEGLVAWMKMHGWINARP